MMESRVQSGSVPSTSSTANFDVDDARFTK